MSSKYCVHCGEKLNPSWKHCSSCGHEILKILQNKKINKSETNKADKSIQIPINSKENQISPDIISPSISSKRAQLLIPLIVFGTLGIILFAVFQYDRSETNHVNKCIQLEQNKRDLIYEMESVKQTYPQSVVSPGGVLQDYEAYKSGQRQLESLRAEASINDRALVSEKC